MAFALHTLAHFSAADKRERISTTVLMLSPRFQKMLPQVGSSEEKETETERKKRKDSAQARIANWSTENIAPFCPEVSHRVRATRWTAAPCEAQRNSCIKPKIQWTPCIDLYISSGADNDPPGRSKGQQEERAPQSHVQTRIRQEFV